MNNDNALRDPATANCRIYVGNLKENTSKQELQNIFAKYGMIRGVMVSRNFGFIQFDNEASANKAIDNENQKLYSGRKIAVSKVQKKTNNPNKPNDKGNNSGGIGIGGGGGGGSSGGGGGGGIGPSNDNNNQNPPALMALNAPDPNMNMNMPQQNSNNAQNNSNMRNIGNMGNMSNMDNMQQMQNAGNHQQRPQWRNNRNNNNRNSSNNSGNEMNLHTDRERSPFDTSTLVASNQFTHIIFQI